MEGQPNYSSIERYLQTNDDPWDRFFLTPKAALSRPRKLFNELNKILEELDVALLPTEPVMLPELSHASGACFSQTLASVDEELLHEPSTSAIDDAFDLSIGLAQCQALYGENSQQSLDKEFILAKAMLDINSHDESEYHCRRILKVYPTIDVQAFLGMILVKTLQPNLAALSLFSCITQYIIEFPHFSQERWMDYFIPIENLLNKLIEESWGPVSSSVIEMMETVSDANLDGTIDQIHPQLLWYGLILAHECLMLNLTDSAKHMYQNLLHICRQIDDVRLCPMEIAAAHRQYGNLLQLSEEWKLSAEQILLACEAVMRGDKSHGLFLTLLKFLQTDYESVIPHLRHEPNEEDPLVEQMKIALDRIQLAPLVHPPVNYIPHFPLPLWSATVSSKSADKDRSSTKSSKSGLRAMTTWSNPWIMSYL